MSRSKFSIWLSAARPQTLPAAVVPVLVGASLAAHDFLFRWDTTIVALLCALLIQIGTNFANDYYDFIKGSDRSDRIGFERATSAGLVQPKSMLFATYFTMTIAFFLGLYLVWIGGWVILVIGLLSLLFGILYTGGPYPLGYNGLGDIFVFIFFGVVAVMGTYYVNAFSWSTVSFWASVPIGALCVNILVVNNLRDIEQDRISGKRTLGVLFGETALKIEYTLLVTAAYFVPIYLFTTEQFSLIILLPLLLIPLSIILLKTIWKHEDKRTLNKSLERTAGFMILYGILFSTGILL
ncbi:MAG: 1,4-dihydroxy-2-naphthoate polyprenyltransferase [Balneolaceae bacterium]|nr:1,4-dihydroxy-2-naphthoate polyprenyltransferase [Balneolaceae bacterium]